MRELLRILRFKFFSSDIKYLKKRLHGKSVAIVGNAKSLFDYKYGKDIDSHDVVIRMNLGYRIINPESQGTKTTILTVADTIKMDLVEQEKPNFEVLGFICSWLVKYKRPSIGNRRYFIYPKKEHDNLESKMGARRPTSGAQMIWLTLLSGAKQIDIYGFDFFKTYNFYEERTHAVPHNFDTEEDWALSLANSGKIEIHGNNKKSRDRVIAKKESEMKTTENKYTDLYKKLHQDQDNYGTSSAKYLPEISLMIDYLKPKTILDYGCGKAVLVDILSKRYPDIKVYGYDPSMPGKDKLPNDKIDLVINTDVLEHIPAEILPNVLKEIAKISKNAIFALHHALAYAVLENGENAHCTVRPPVWYQNEIMNAFGDEISVFSGREHYLSMITTFPVHPHIIDTYYKILFDTRFNVKNKKKPHGLKRLWKHLRKLKF